MSLIDRVTARLVAQGMSAAQAAAAAGTIASAGYDLAEKTTASPAGLSAARTSVVRRLQGRAGASVHAVKCDDALGWQVWVELPGAAPGQTVRLAPVFAARPEGFVGDDPFTVVVGP